MYVDETPSATADASAVPFAASTLGDRLADVTAFGAAVRSDQVVMEPEAGRRLRDALREQADAAADWANRLRGMSRPSPLGSNWVGESMSAKFERRADGEDVSFVGVLDQYSLMLREAVDSIDEAVRRYEANEDDSVETFSRLRTQA